MKFNKNEFGWKEKVNINTNELVTKNDIPHYNETLMFEITGDDYRFFRNNNYFNMSALNIDETKSYVGKDKFSINDDEEYTIEFIYNKENDTLINEYNQLYIYNHKSYNGTNFIEDENSAVLTNNITPMVISEYDGYFRLYEVEKLELDNKCLPNDVSIVNSLTVGSRLGDIGEYSVAEGDEITASGDYSHAEGSSTIANGYVSHAEGDSTTASGYGSHAEGSVTTASGDSSHAEGNLTTASGNASHAEGNSTTASSNYSHAEGFKTTASDNSSHAEGNSSNSISSVISDFSSSTSNDDILTAWNTNKFSLAKGEASHVEGTDSLALGNYSHAEGNSTTASSNYSHAEGFKTTASDNSSHAEGSWATASGVASHAEGFKTTASGDSSHAEGSWATASGVASHAEGSGTTALGQYQHVQGKYNIEDTENKYAHIVGNGTADNARSNAHTLDWNGNAWYAGKLTQEGTPTEDKDLTTKKYVDDAIASQPQISFDTEGNLVVTIGGVTKKFKEITE